MEASKASKLNINQILLFLATFALMFFYWKYLNMFQTMRYLALISMPLFLFGHRVLSTLAVQR